MALAVIGAGFGRTGTMSLKVALEELGMGLSHHMDEVFQNPAQLPNWQAAAAGKPVDWDAVYEGYSCTVDWPGAHFWRELSDHFPEAKVVLTMRSADSWWESFSSTILKFFRENAASIPDPHFKGVADMANAIVVDQTLGGESNNKAVAIEAYERHVKAVQDGLSSDRLLCFDVRD